MCAKHYENPTMLSRVTAKNVGDVFFETHCTLWNNDVLRGLCVSLSEEKGLQLVSELSTGAERSAGM